jgi:molybdopterin-guanine dinucleotide biosynthesis protein A
MGERWWGSRGKVKLNMTRDAGQIAGFVLAGGESSRMGRDKALLVLDGVPLVARAVALVETVAGTASVIGHPEKFRSLQLAAIADDWPGAGPLGGIATALRASESPWSLVIACDMPYLTKAWLDFLVTFALSSQADAVLPMNERGVEPLCGVYHKRCESAIWLALDRGTRKVTDGLAGVHMEHIEPAEWKAFDSAGLLFKNMNSPADYEEAKAMLEGRGE